MPTVLLTIAAPVQRTFFASQLVADDFRVVDASDHGEAVLGAQFDTVDAVVIDLALRDGNGLRLLREIRSERHAHLEGDLPVLALLGTNSGDLELARVFGAGADDVARQPVGYVELRCRLESLLRRCRLAHRRSRRRRVSALEIDLAARTTTVHGASVTLSRLEFDLLAVLTSDPERVFSKRELLKQIWGVADDVKMRLPQHEQLPEPRVHPGRDWFYVLHGTLRLQLGGREVLVRAGQAASFNTMTPHTLGGHNGPAEILSIFDRYGERAHLSDR